MGPPLACEIRPFRPNVPKSLVPKSLNFLPSFFFILLGGPYVEFIRGNTYLTAALSGVTAAVVGVVLNLALVFGAAVIWPHGLVGPPQWFAVLMTATAFGLLYRYKVDVLWVVLGGAAIGCIGRVLGG